MNYVRTKDEIVDISNYIDKDSYYQDTKSPDYIGKEKIIKEADTIEELCDGICAIERNGKLKVPYVGKTTQDLKVIIDLIDKDNYEVYGAIWTDRGFDYVAKMKGVLPNGEIDWELL